MELPKETVGVQVAAALAEDLGDGDKTADLIPAGRRAVATVVCREAAVLCGRPWFDEVFRRLDSRTTIEWRVEEGAPLISEQTVCRLEGEARVLLSGERTALNFLQILSGTATLTARYVEAAANPDVRLLDTRKTVPGLRMAQKYAVRCGGGHNHRLGLYDAVLIKENHIQAAGGVSHALHAAHKAHPQLEVEIEVEDLGQLQEALASGAERILLDNFELGQLTRAVEINGGRARLEASGGVDLSTIAAIAATGVDDISVGALTKDVRAVDFSMRFE